jgi:hypothetical protein
MAKARTKAMDARPHIEIVTRKEDNPLFSYDHDADKLGNFRKIDVAINIRESSIETMFARGYINRAQREAADEFRRLFEMMGGSGARAIDWRREAVDGGRFPDPIGESAIDAGKKLAAAHDVLTKVHGLYGWRLIGYICGEGRSVSELTATRRQRDTMMDNMRTYLNCLVDHWGFGTRRP